MLCLPIIDAPNALGALISAMSQQKWSPGYSFSMFKREPKKEKKKKATKRKQCTTGKAGTCSQMAALTRSAILGNFRGAA